MEIDRRNLLLATAGLAMVKLVEPTFSPPRHAGLDKPPWHPLTRSLLDRARRASLVDGRANRPLIEGLIQQEVDTKRYANPPVIKWLDDPFDAFAYLSRLGLDELLQVDATRLWRRAGAPVSTDDDRLDLAAALGSRIEGLVRSAGHDDALMSPKLLAKARVMAESQSAEAFFKVRAVAAQIGWLETCMPVVAAQAVTDVELLLSSGASEKSIHHQLRVFEAYELGLLATWETPDAIICVPRTPAV